MWKPTSRFPSSDLDLAFVTPDSVTAEKVDKAIKQAAGALLVDLALFDVYRGAGVPPGSRSLAYRLRLQALDRTLGDSELTDLRNQGHRRRRQARRNDPRLALPAQERGGLDAHEADQRLLGDRQVDGVQAPVGRTITLDVVGAWVARVAVDGDRQVAVAVSVLHSAVIRPGTPMKGVVIVAASSGSVNTHDPVGSGGLEHAGAADQ